MAKNVAQKLLIPDEVVIHKILFLREKRVMVDKDIAELYGVSTKRLKEQVKRNKKRFPVDFMFQLTQEEKDEVVANCDHLKNLKYSPNLPFVFTEHGAVMLDSVLNSDRAIEVNMIQSAASPNPSEGGALASADAYTLLVSRGVIAHC